MEVDDAERDLAAESGDACTAKGRGAQPGDDGVPE